MAQAPHNRPAGIAERIEDLRLPLLVTGLSREIAPELAAIARPGDRERRRQHEIGVALLLRVGVMGEVIPAIGQGIREYRVGAQPLAEGQVARLVARKAPVRALMHEDGKAELARADHHDGENVGERVGEDRDEGDRPKYDGPGMSDEREAPPFDTPAQGGKLVRRKELPGSDAVGSGGRGDGHREPHLDLADGWVEAVTRRGPCIAADLRVPASASSPSASRMAADIAAALRPMAWPSSAMPRA